MGIKSALTGQKSKPKERSEELIKPKERSREQKYFEEQRKNFSDREIQMELLYSQKILIDKMDKVRGNTNTLIWWLIAIPIIIGGLVYIVYS